MKTDILMPLNDCVVVLAEAERTKTNSGLFLPDSAVKKPQVGTVMNCRDDGVVEIGDVVVFNKYAGTDFEFAGLEVMLLRETDLLAKFPKGVE